MNLVKINDCYVNADRIDLIGETEDGSGTSILIGGSDDELIIDLPISEVVETLESSERYTQIGVDAIEGKALFKDSNRMIRKFFDGEHGGSKR